MSRPLAFLRRLPRYLLVAPVVVYRRLISPLKPQPTCRFHPTCSHYAHDAILTHGALRGGALAVVRVAKCHPFHPGGFDPVPPPRDAVAPDAAPDRAAPDRAAPDRATPDASALHAQRAPSLTPLREES